MAAVGTFRHGKSGRVTIGDSPNDVNIKVTKWSVTDSAPKADTTNFESFVPATGVTPNLTSSGAGSGRSYTQGLVGLETVVITIEGYFDFGFNPLDNLITTVVPPAPFGAGLYIRDDGPHMRFLLSRDTGPIQYNLPDTMILSVAIGVDVAGAVTVAFTVENQGRFTRPTGSIPPVPAPPP